MWLATQIGLFEIRYVGDLPPAAEGEPNNQREETERWAQKLRALVQGEPSWTRVDERYPTGITGNLPTS